MRTTSVRRHLRRTKTSGVVDVRHHQRSFQGRDRSEIDALKRIPLRSNVLPVQFKIIVPSTTNHDEPLSDDPEKAKLLMLQRVNAEKKFIDKTFGGDTSIEEVGSYWDGSKVINENGVLIMASTTHEKYNRYAKRLAQHIKNDRKKWKQDTVLYGVEGVNYIYPKKKYIDSE